VVNGKRRKRSGGSKKSSTLIYTQHKAIPLHNLTIDIQSLGVRLTTWRPLLSTLTTSDVPLS
jgi:hypothetical protein